MGDTGADLDWLRAITRGETFLAKSDLLILDWALTAPDAMSPEFPGCRVRDVLLAAWSHRARRDQWAHDGLRKLYLHLRQEGEAVPAPLQAWIDRNIVAGGEPPNRGRGRKPNIDRDMRIGIASRSLVAFNDLPGVRQTSADEAVEAIADSVHLSPERVESIVRKS